MATLTASSLTYKVSLDELKKLIAKDLGYPEKAIEIKYVIKNTSNYDRGYPSSADYRLTAIEIVVNQVEADKHKPTLNLGPR